MAGRPLRINRTTPTSLVEMSSSEVADGIIYRILKEFAKINAATPLTGDLTLLDTVGNVATALAGDYVDTTRVKDVGSRGTSFELSGVTQTTTSVYQVLSSVSGSYIRPVCYRNGHLEEMTDADILDTIISPALDSMTNRGIGSYHFSNGVPRDPSTGASLGGTWTSVFTVRDSYKSGNISNTSIRTYVNNTGDVGTTSTVGYTLTATNTNESTTYTLWRKTDDIVPTTQPRPVRFANTADRGKHLVEMTNAEILTLLIPFRNAIITDGRGRYRFSATAPTSGTWARRGDRIVDLLNTIGTGTYAWAYAQSFTGAYTGYYTSVYTGYFTHSSTVTRNVTYNGKGPGRKRFVSFSRTFTSQIEKYFSRPEASVVNRTYAKLVPVYYTTPIVSAVTLIENEDYLWVKRAN